MHCVFVFCKSLSQAPRPHMLGPREVVEGVFKNIFGLFPSAKSSVDDNIPNARESMHLSVSLTAASEQTNPDRTLKNRM